MSRSTELESMSKEDVSIWLDTKGYSDSMKAAFTDQEMDGNAISLGFASSPGPDWLKDVVPTLGLRLKVYNDLRSLVADESQNGVYSTVESEVQLFTPSRSRASNFTPYRVNSPVASEDPLLFTPPQHGSSSRASNFTPPTLDSGSASYISENLSITPKSTSVKVELPDPFPLPRFRHETDENLKKKILYDTDRKHCVQTVATVLMQYVPKPSLKHCGIVAKEIIKCYPFLKDDEGDGEHSWKWFLYYRTQNINRQTSHSGPAKKKKRVEPSAAHMFPRPPASADDTVSNVRNLKLLTEEMERSKPRSDVLQHLMRRTYAFRWDSFSEKGDPATLSEYIELYPLLKRSFYATLDFSTGCGQPDIRAVFEDTFPIWAKAIITYAKDTQIRSTSLQLETSGYSEDISIDALVIMALRCLALLFFPGKTKKLADGVPYILSEFAHGTPLAEVIDHSNNQPNILFLKDDDDIDPIHQLFVATEQKPILETSNLITAVFLALAAHYVFNLQYHCKTGDFWMFLQERVLGIPSKPGKKRHASSTTHFAGIARKYEVIKTD